jgi:hypothetical protein
MASDELKARILEAARHRPSPAREQVSSRNTALLASAVLVPVALFLALGSLEAGARPAGLIFTTAAGSLAIAAAAVWAAFGRGGQMVGRARGWLLAVCAAAPTALLGWKLAWSAGFPETMEPSAGRPGYRCLALTLLLAAWPMVVVFLVRRESDATHPRALGAALGVMSGACAAVLVDLWCPVGHAPHLLLGHVLPMVLLGGLGYWFGQRVLAVRAR